jgi:hypothetical protein
MTALTSSPPPVRPGRIDFTQLLRAEWIKFRTVRGWIIAVIVATLLTLLFAVFIAHGDHSAPCSTGPGNSCDYAALPLATLASGGPAACLAG